MYFLMHKYTIKIKLEKDLIYAIYFIQFMSILKE